MKKLKEFESSIAGTASAVVRVFRFIWPGHRKIVMAFFAVSILASFMPFVSSGAQALLINELLGHGDHGFTAKIIAFVVLYLGATYCYDFLTSLRGLVDKRLWINLTEFFELTMLRKRKNAGCHLASVFYGASRRPDLRPRGRYHHRTRPSRGTGRERQILRSTFQVAGERI